MFRYFLLIKNLPYSERLVSVLYFGFLGSRIAQQLGRYSNQVNLNIVYSAVIGYLLIGIIGGEFCLLLDMSTPNPVFAEDSFSDTYKYYYFSFVTLSTVGYGDITPQDDSGRALALFIGLAGQIYLTITMAIIIGKYLNKDVNPTPQI